MAFGVTGTGISRETSHAVQTANKTDQVGSVTEMTSFGGMQTKTEEVFSSSFTNEAVNGQTGNTGAGLVSEHTLIESNEDYARERKVTMTPLAAPA